MDEAVLTLDDGLDLVDETVEDVDFTGQSARLVTIKRTTLHRCRLAAVELKDLLLVDVELHDCVLSGADLPGATLTNVTIRACRLDDTNLRMARTEQLVVESSDLRRCDLYDADLSGARFDRCQLEGAVVDRARLDGADLRGSDLFGVRGAASMKGVRVDADQLPALARTLAADIGIVVVDDAVTDEA